MRTLKINKNSILTSLIKLQVFIYIICLSAISSGHDNDLNNSEGNSGFKRRSLFINTGFLYGCGALGGEVEYGVFNKIGLQIGAGFFGLNTGANFHIYSSKRHDISIGGLTDYLPGIKSVVPELNIGYRFFPGKKDRVGIAMRCGIATAIKDNMIKDGKRLIEFKKGRPFLTYAIGVSIKAIKGIPNR